MKLDALRSPASPAPAPAMAGERLSVRVEKLALMAEVGVYASEHVGQHCRLERRAETWQPLQTETAPGQHHRNAREGLPV